MTPAQSGHDRTLRPCRCGLTPSTKICGPHKLRVECACGAHGVTLAYNFPEQIPQVAQAAADGWNLAGASG